MTNSQDWETQEVIRHLINDEECYNELIGKSREVIRQWVVGGNAPKALYQKFQQEPVSNFDDVDWNTVAVALQADDDDPLVALREQLEENLKRVNTTLDTTLDTVFCVDCDGARYHYECAQLVYSRTAVYQAYDGQHDSIHVTHGHEWKYDALEAMVHGETLYDTCDTCSGSLYEPLRFVAIQLPLPGFEAIAA
jgi:hypothetical protein